jgi:hypothetical protein
MPRKELIIKLDNDTSIIVMTIWLQDYNRSSCLSYLQLVRWLGEAGVAQLFEAYKIHLPMLVEQLTNEVFSGETSFDLIMHPPSSRKDYVPYFNPIRAKIPEAIDISSLFSKSDPSCKIGVEPMEEADKHFIFTPDEEDILTISKSNSLLIIDDIFAKGTTCHLIISRLLPLNSRLTFTCAFPLRIDR